MERRQRTVVVFIAVVAVVVGLGIWTFGKPANERDDLEDRLAAAAAVAGDGGQIDLAEVADFPWDRVHIFEAYTSPEEVGETLGFDWSPLSRFESVTFGSLFMSNDGFALFVFVRGDREVTGYRVVSPYEQPTVYVDVPTNSFPRASATLSVTRTDTNEGPIWVLAPPRP